MKHLMRLSAFSKKEIMEILNLADQLKFERKNNIKHPILKGKTLGMLMTNPASGTRASFEVGMFDLGGHALMLSHNGLSTGRWDSVSDLAAVLTRFVDCIAVRADSQEEAEAFAEGSIVPVINAKTDMANPCHALADLMTIREYKGSYEGRKLCCVGSGGAANSIIVGAMKMGMEVSVACAESHLPGDWVLEYGKECGLLTVTNSVAEAIKDADVVHIQEWILPEDRGYCVDSEMMAFAKKDAIVLHCLPVHRGEEITEDVLSLHQTEIYDQAENRLHAQKAVIAKLLRENN